MTSVPNGNDSVIIQGSASAAACEDPLGSVGLKYKNHGDMVTCVGTVEGTTWEKNMTQVPRMYAQQLLKKHESMEVDEMAN